MNTLKALILSAPDDLRAELRLLATKSAQGTRNCANKTQLPQLVAAAMPVLLNQLDVGP